MVLPGILPAELDGKYPAAETEGTYALAGQEEGACKLWGFDSGFTLYSLVHERFLHSPSLVLHLASGCLPGLWHGSATNVAAVWCHL